MKFFVKQILDIKNKGIKEFFKKIRLFIISIFNFFFSIIFLPFCILIKLLSPFLLFRIEALPTQNFGNFAAYTAMYYSKKKLGLENLSIKHVDLFYIPPNFKNYNKHLAKMWARKLKILPSIILHPMKKVLNYMPSQEKHSIPIFHTKIERDINNIVKKCRPLEFTKDENIKGLNILKNFGLSEKDKFVSLIIRDDAYSYKKIPKDMHDNYYHQFRHYNINSFKLTAESLTQKGYFVFRMGNVVNEKFNLNNPKVIDYANSKLKSDFMDIYIGAKSIFCISTDTGYQDIPGVFDKPIAQLPIPLGGALSYSDKFFLLTKKHICKLTGKTLNMDEIFNRNVGFAYDTKIYEENNVKLEDPSSEEIRDFVHFIMTDTGQTVATAYNSGALNNERFACQ